jgi:hypothetical protein
VILVALFSAVEAAEPPRYYRIELEDILITHITAGPDWGTPAPSIATVGLRDPVTGADLGQTEVRAYRHVVQMGAVLPIEAPAAVLEPRGIAGTAWYGGAAKGSFEAEVTPCIGYYDVTNDRWICEGADGAGVAPDWTTVALPDGTKVDLGLVIEVLTDGTWRPHLRGRARANAANMVNREALSAFAATFSGLEVEVDGEFDRVPRGLMARYTFDDGHSLDTSHAPQWRSWGTSAAPAGYDRLAVSGETQWVDAAGVTTKSSLGGLVVADAVEREPFRRGLLGVADVTTAAGARELRLFTSLKDPLRRLDPSASAVVIQGGNVVFAGSSQLRLGPSMNVFTVTVPDVGLSERAVPVVLTLKGATRSVTVGPFEVAEDGTPGPTEVEFAVNARKVGRMSYEKLRTDPSHVGEAMWTMVVGVDANLGFDLVGVTASVDGGAPVQAMSDGSYVVQSVPLGDVVGPVDVTVKVAGGDGSIVDTVQLRSNPLGSGRGYDTLSKGNTARMYSRAGT